jgi:hypothetical protein
MNPLDQPKAFATVVADTRNSTHPAPYPPRDAPVPRRLDTAGFDAIIQELR